MNSSLTQVALVHCPSYDEDALPSTIRDAVNLVGGMEKYVSSGQRVMLKPNAIAPAAADHPSITHPHFIIAVAKLVQEAGGVPVIADSPAWGNMQQVAEASCLDREAEKIGVEILQLTDVATVSAEIGGRSICLKHGKETLDADVLINLPKLKTHRQLGFTGGTKNMYGAVPGRRKALWHLLSSRTDLHFARKLIDHYVCAIPHLTIVDAVVIMEGTGPRLGTPRNLGAVLAGTDCLAIDHVCAEMLCLPESHRLILTAAREMGVGCTGVEEVEILGELLRRFTLKDVRLPELLGAGFSPYRILRGTIRNWYLTRSSRDRSS